MNYIAYRAGHASSRSSLFFLSLPGCNGGFFPVASGLRGVDGRAEYWPTLRAHLSIGPQRCAMALDVQTCAVFTVIAFLVLVNVLLFILGTR